jgi:surface antigen
LVLAGCKSPRYEWCGTKSCGSPCDHIQPKKFTEDSLLDAYTASASARDLPHDDLVLAASITQGLFNSGNFGETAYWRSDNTGNHGEVRLLKPLTEGVTQCLTYRQSISMTHRATIIAEGKACRETYGGIWAIVEEVPIWRR